jgi:hypothetical protein
MKSVEVAALLLLILKLKLLFWTMSYTFEFGQEEEEQNKDSSWSNLKRFQGIIHVIDMWFPYGANCLLNAIDSFVITTSSL